MGCHVAVCLTAGLLVYSILFLEEQRYVLSGVLFAVLLNMKHLFAYLAPIYFIFLLKHYVLPDSSSNSSSSSSSWALALVRLAVLGGAVLAVCGVSFGPFVAMGQMQQVSGPAVEP
jgi:alpha-1,3-glucosyltransferase